MVLLSCDENSKKIERKDRSFKKQVRDKLIGLKGDTLYKRSWLRINFPNGIVDETEVYISNFNDTIMNQFKTFNNGVINRDQSEYYDLEISHTDKPHFYKGKITLHSIYENLKLDKENQRTLEFAYCEQSKDSVYLTYVESKTSNTIEFGFQNYFGDRLQGKLYQLVFRDTLINGEEMLNMRETNVLVDNYPETVNLFLAATTNIRKKKFNPDKIKLKPTN